MSNIALALRRSQSAISRANKRNTGKRGHQYRHATKIAKDRHTHTKKTVKITADKKEIISDLIREEWSPKQVAGKLTDNGVMSIHHETIYQYILEDKRGGIHSGIPNPTCIGERPKVVENRKHVGD